MTVSALLRACEARGQSRFSCVGGDAPRSTVAPSASSRWKSRRLRLRSNPAYNIAWGLPSSLEDARSMTPREALLHGIPYHGIPAAAGGNGFAPDQAVFALPESRTFATRCAPSVP